MTYCFNCFRYLKIQSIMYPYSSNDTSKSRLQLYFLINYIQEYTVVCVKQYVENMDTHDCCSAGRTTRLDNYQYLHGTILIHVHREKLKVVPGAQSMVSLPRMNCVGLAATPSGHSPGTNSRSSSMHCGKASYVTTKNPNNVNIILYTNNLYNTYFTVLII